MSHAKQPSKRKRRSKALPVLGVAGLTLSLASGASAVPGGPATDMATPNTGDHEITLGEEEISDVTLATFYVFDKESAGTPGPNIQLAKGCHGCHGCHGCRGCHRAAEAAGVAGAAEAASAASAAEAASGCGGFRSPRPGLAWGTRSDALPSLMLVWTASRRKFSKLSGTTLIRKQGYRFAGNHFNRPFSIQH